MKWPNVSTMGAVALALSGAYALWLVISPSKPSAPLVVATQAPQVAMVETVEIKPAKVQVYARKAKVKLSLPAAVQADPMQHVAAASRVESSDRPVTVTTLLDERTGAVTTYTREEPLPWLAAGHSGEASIAYGMRSGQMMGRIMVRQDILQIKAARIGAQATIDQDGQWFAGAGIVYRW